MKLHPRITHRRSHHLKVSRNGDKLTLSGTGVDTTLDFSDGLPEIDEDLQHIVRSVRDLQGEPIIELSAYQPDSRKILFAQPLIDLKDGESIKFPDYYDAN